MCVRCYIYKQQQGNKRARQGRQTSADWTCWLRQSHNPLHQQIAMATAGSRQKTFPPFCSGFDCSASTLVNFRGRPLPKPFKGIGWNYYYNQLVKHHTHTQTHTCWSGEVTCGVFSRSSVPESASCWLLLQAFCRVRFVLRGPGSAHRAGARLIPLTSDAPQITFGSEGVFLKTPFFFFFLGSLVCFTPWAGSVLHNDATGAAALAVTLALRYLEGEVRLYSPVRDTVLGAIGGASFAANHTSSGEALRWKHAEGILCFSSANKLQLQSVRRDQATGRGIEN